MSDSARIGILALALCGFATPVAAQQPVGDFYFFPRTDAETGEDRSSITTLADESFTSGAGGLTFQCTADGLSLIVSASYLGRTMSTPVRYAFGEEQPAASSWTVRSTGMAVIAPEEVRDDFIEGALGQESVVFRVSDFQMRRHTYTFHLDGLETALDKLSCR